MIEKYKAPSRTITLGEDPVTPTNADQESSAEYSRMNFAAHMNKVIKSSLNKSNLEGGFPREAIEYPSSSSEEEQDQFERIETKVLSNKDEL